MATVVRLDDTVTKAATKAARELFRTPPDAFVTARNSLVRELKSEGQRDSAAAIASMRRPSWVDWALNVTAGEDADLVGAFAEAAAGMRHAQQRAIEGGPAGKSDIRAAMGELRDRSGQFARRVNQVLTGHGRPPAIAEITERLASIAADADATEQLRTGTLRETDGTGNELFTQLAAAPDPGSDVASKAESDVAQRSPRPPSKSDKAAEPRPQRGGRPATTGTARSAADQRAAKDLAAQDVAAQELVPKELAVKDLREAERAHRSAQRELARADTALRHATDAVATATEALARASAALEKAQQRRADAEANREGVRRKVETAEQNLARARASMSRQA